MAASHLPVLVTTPAFPEAGRPADAVLADLATLRAKDTTFSSGRILGSMCTVPHPVAVKAYHTFLETNLGDPAICRGAEEAERRALHAIAGLARAPPGFGGAFVSGGSEANFTALRIATKATGKREIVLPETAHFSFDKAVDYLGLRARIARATPEWRTDPDAVTDAITRDTACVVAVAGSTEHGVVDPVPEIARACHDAGVPLHVDAAWGGFIIPFARRLGVPVPDFGFSVDGVTTVAIDPHKMGLAPIPSGVLLAREKRLLDLVGIPSPYVSVERQPTIQGTRPGAAPAAALAAIEHLGAEGYQRIVAECLDVARHLAARLKAMGVRLAREPELTIVAFVVADPPLVRRLLAERGYLVSLAPLSGGLKVVVMPHVTRAAVDAFLPVLQDTLKKTGDL